MCFFELGIYIYIMCLRIICMHTYTLRVNARVYKSDLFNYILIILYYY